MQNSAVMFTRLCFVISNITVDELDRCTLLDMKYVFHFSPQFSSGICFAPIIA